MPQKFFDNTMKKTFLLLMCMVGVLSVKADSYSYLTFETTDGAKASVAVASLALTISGTTLTAGTETFTLSNLSKMYFSETDETITGIEDAQTTALTGQLIYDLQGHKVSKEQMTKGIYIVKTADKTYKLVVK